MAFVMLRNVKNVSSSSYRIRALFHPRKFTVSSTKPLSNVSISSLKNTKTIHKDTWRQLCALTATPISHPAEIQDSSELSKDDVLESIQQPVRFNVRFKTKAAFMKHFNQKLSSGDVLTTKDAFILLKSCGPRMVGETDESRNELVRMVWDALEKNGVPLETGLWNTLLSVYIENRCDFEPLEFLKQLWEKSIAEPNKTTFSLLIQAYAMKGDPAGAMKIVEFRMKNDDSRMTEHIYAWLVQAFAKKGDMEGVEEILRTMKDNGVKPKHTTFGNLIDAHAERGDLESINKTIQDMIDQQIYPSTEMYMSLLNHLSLGGHNHMIPQVWERIDAIENLGEDVKPLIQRFITRGHYESALQLLLCSTEMKSKKKENYYGYIEKRLLNNIRFSEKDTTEYLHITALIENHLSQQPLSRLNRLVDFLLSKNEPDVAITVIDKVFNDGNTLKVQLFHPILNHYADKRDIQGIVNVYKFMTDKDIDLDFYCYRNIIPAIGKPGTDSYNLYLAMVKDNEKIKLPSMFVDQVLQNDDVELNHISSIVDKVSAASLFSSLKKLKKTLLQDFNANDAAKVCIALHRKGMTDISVLIDELMASVSPDSNKKPDEALEFLKILMENEIPISSVSYTKMLKSLHSSGMSDQFFMFVRLMKEHGVDPDVHQYYQMLKMAATVGNSMAAQFCFDKVMGSDAFPERRHELYEYLISAYSRDTESTKIIPTYIDRKESENALKVIQLFEEMIEKNYRPSQSVVTMVIRSHLLNLDIDGAKRVIEQYGEGKEQLRNTVKNSFMRAYVAKKDYAAAENLFEEMKGEKSATSLQYNEMMRMCEANGNTERVEALFKEMKDDGFTPNVFSYLHRIRTHIANKQPEPCIDILLENIANGRNILRVDIFMIVLRHLVPTGNVDNVKKVIELIREHHITKVPPKRLDHALTLAYIKAGNIEEASKLLPTAPEGSEEPVEIELNPYRKVAKTALVEGDVDYIEKIMKFLKVNGLYYQSLDTFYLLALNRIGDVDGIRRLYQERLDDGVSPNEKFVSILENIVEDRQLQGFEFPPTDDS